MPRDEFIGQLIATTYKFLSRNHNAMTRRFDLTPPQLCLLRKLYEEEDGLSSSELVRRLLSDSSTIMAVVDRLEKKGLIRREVDQRDRRVNHIFLTDRAKKILPEAIDRDDELNRFIHKNFSPQEIETLKAGLTKIYRFAAAYYENYKNE